MTWWSGNVSLESQTKTRCLETRCANEALKTSECFAHPRPRPDVQPPLLSIGSPSILRAHRPDLGLDVLEGRLVERRLGLGHVRTEVHDPHAPRPPGQI